MEYQSRNTPVISLQHIGTKLKDQISRYQRSSPDDDLVRACMNGMEAAIRELKPTMQELNHCEPELFGMAPLHLACWFGHREVVIGILESGADVNIRVEKTISKETPLHVAAGNGYSDVVKVLLEYGANPNSVASNHLKTPLHVAVSEGHLDIVRVLLQGGAVNHVPRPASLSRFGSWCSPLHLACQRGHLEIVRSLLEHGANINIMSEDPRRASVLHEGVENHQLEIVKYLLDLGVKSNVFDSCGFSPLHSAAKHGFVDIIDLLIKGGAEVDCFDDDPMHTPLITSIVSGQYDSVKTLLEAGAKVDGILNDAAPLYQAIRHESACLPLVELLISFGANESVPDEIGYYPLHCAAYYGQYEIADFFLKRGHDPNLLSESPDDIGQRETILHCAVYGNNRDVFQLLVKAGVSVNSVAQPGKQTPLYCAVLNHKVEMVEHLIKLDADVNVQDASGVTPLHHAITSQNNEIIRMLIKKGAFLEATSLGDELTPLHIAVIDGTKDSVELLIDSGASASVASAHGETPLHFAAELNCLQKVELLLQNEADVNSSDCNGTTPLHLASVKRHDAVVELLCTKENAIVDFKDCSGVTPLHLAAFNGHTIAVRILLKSGADPTIPCNGEQISSICCRRGFQDVSRLFRESQVPSMVTTQPTVENTQSHSATLSRYLELVLETDGIGKVSQLRGAQRITQTVSAFIKELMKAVAEFDPRFNNEVALSGSNSESSKVGEPDEFDFMFYLPSLTEQFEPSYSSDDPPGYCKIELKQGISSESVKDLLKDEKYLFPQRIKACLFSHIEDMFLLNRVEVPKQIRFYFHEFSPDSGKHRIVNQIKPGFILHFEWRQGLYTGLNITADVIPTFPFDHPKDVFLNYTSQSRDLLSELEGSSNPTKTTTTSCLIPTPIAHHVTRSFENVVWRISTSKLETKILQRIPDCKRNTYMKGKILLQRSGKVPDRDGLGSCEYYIHTYLLKTAFLYELSRVPDDESWEGCNAVVRLLYIFRLLKGNINAGRVPSFFIKGYDLLLDEDSITEREARIWILDAILSFLSSTNDLQHVQMEPRGLERMLQSRRPESISTREVRKGHQQDAPSLFPFFC